MNTVAEIRNLTFTFNSYPGTTSGPLFTDVSLDLFKHEVHILYGRPESGKTTFGRLLAGLVPMYHGGRLSGSVTIGDKAVIGNPAHDLLRTIGLVFQNPEEQLFMPVCEDEIIFPLEHMGLTHEEMEERLERVIDFYELGSYRVSNPASLSGGEKKRLLMAVLDAIDPDLWVLDETFEELDTRWREKILHSLAERGKSVLILASKDIELYHRYGNRFSCIIEQESGNTILTSDEETVLASLDDRLGSIALPAVSRAPEERVCSAQDLSFTYAHQEHRFSLQIDGLDLYRGEILALYGPNGSGKSTLCRLLCGLLKPDGGRILTREGVTPATSLTKHTGYLFQNPDFQIFLPTIHEELGFGLKQKGIGRKEAEPLITEAAGLFRLGALHSPPAIMSYGKRKRLQAAVYYLLDRKVCILDETDSGISLEDYTMIISLLAKRVDALIFITHDMRIAEHCAHRIVMMGAGRITGEKNLCR